MEKVFICHAGAGLETRKQGEIGILGAGVAAWSLHVEAFLIYLKCLEENG